MELEHTNPNGEIILGGKLYQMELLLFYICKNYIQKWILQVIFSERYSKCPKNKIVHNFLITNPNGMNQSFLDRQKYNILEKYFKKLNSIFCKKNLLPPLPCFELIWA